MLSGTAPIVLSDSDDEPELGSLNTPTAFSSVAEAAAGEFVTPTKRQPIHFTFEEDMGGAVATAGGASNEVEPKEEEPIAKRQKKSPSKGQNNFLAHGFGGMSPSEILRLKGFGSKL